VEENKLVVKVAHHISGFWAPIKGKDSLRTGSIGAGLLITPYAIGQHVASRVFLINRSKKKPLVVKTAEKLLGREYKKGIYIREPLPLGRGYAGSAAVVLAYTLLRLIDEKDSFSYNLMGRIAHIAEIEAKTGLGDVAAITYGSYIPVRREAGAPGLGRIDSIIPKDANKCRILTLDLGYYPTRKLLDKKLSLYRKEGIKCLENLDANPSLETFLEESRRFSLATGMMDKKTEEKARGLSKKYDVLGYYMKKKLLVMVVSNIEKAEIKQELKNVFGRGKVREHRLAGDGIVISAVG
jgi:pantoate kinase